MERANKEVMRHLRAILLDKNIVDEWSILLPLVQRIMNASVHSAIGVSPAQVIFGNAITLDKGIFIPHDKKRNGTVTVSEWAENMLNKQAKIIQIAKGMQESTDDFTIAQKSAERTEYPVNSYVLMQYRDRPPSKFHSNWAGPLRVVGNKQNTYTLQDLVTGKLKDVHITQLKEFQYDMMETDPRDIARKEKQEFVVEKVLQHRGNPKKRGTMEFLVQWLNYPGEDSWTEWENIRDNSELNKYLYNNKLKMLLTP